MLPPSTPSIACRPRPSSCPARAAETSRPGMITPPTRVWFAIAAVAMLGAVWLAEQPGSLTAEFHGWRLDTSVGMLAVIILVAIVLGVGAWVLYRWIAGVPGNLLEGWFDSKRRRGYRELT